MEYDGLPHLALGVWSISIFETNAAETSHKTDRTIAPNFLEQQQLFSIFEVITDTLVTTREGHCSRLPLTEVMKNSIIRPAIIVAMLGTRRTSES